MAELFSFLEPPIFTNKPSLHVGVKRGSNLNLCCEAKGYPRPSIEWSRAQQSPDLLPAFQENGCLKINAIKENEGDYICRATNRFGLAETTTKVIVTLTGFVYSISFKICTYCGSCFILSFETDLENYVYATSK